MEVAAAAAVPEAEQPWPRPQGQELLELPLAGLPVAALEL